uniref:Uncharacterized protein n=1 Tax=Timema monikensis TaxID=170555 RepID=A0A7R9E2D1_9NEOP|nr:unnamed protein product [Timema monikensis]
MPVGVPWPTYLTFFSAALLSMMAGAQRLGLILMCLADECTSAGGDSSDALSSYSEGCQSSREANVDVSLNPAFLYARRKSGLAVSSLGGKSVAIETKSRSLRVSCTELTYLTEERVESEAVINLNGLVSKHCTAVNEVEVLHPYSIIVLKALLLLAQEVVQGQGLADLLHNPGPNKAPPYNCQFTTLGTDCQVVTHPAEHPGVFEGHGRPNVYVASVANLDPSRRALAAQYTLVVHVEGLIIHFQQLRAVEPVPDPTRYRQSLVVPPPVVLGVNARLPNLLCASHCNIKLTLEACFLTSSQGHFFTKFDNSTELKHSTCNPAPTVFTDQERSVNCDHLVVVIGVKQDIINIMLTSRPSNDGPSGESVQRKVPGTQIVY